jgi:hypothetical protein
VGSALELALQHRSCHGWYSCDHLRGIQLQRGPGGACACAAHLPILTPSQYRAVAPSKPIPSMRVCLSYAFTSAITSSSSSGRSSTRTRQQRRSRARRHPRPLLISYIVANTSACLRTLHFNSGTGSLVFPRRASSVLSSISPGGDVPCVAETTEIGPRVVTNKEGICTEY